MEHNKLSCKQSHGNQMTAYPDFEGNRKMCYRTLLLKTFLSRRVCRKILFLRYFGIFSSLSAASWELCASKCVWWRIGFCHLCTTSPSLTFWLSQSSPLQRSASELLLSADNRVPTSTINNALLKCCMYCTVCCVLV